MKKLIFIFLIAFILGGWVNQLANKTSSPKPKEGQIKVAKVIDGDTIELNDGQKVRYIGIDTPESVDPREPVQCFGKEASQKNKELVEGKEVRLEKDVSETDRYGRLLRYVYVGEIFVNDYLVRQGYAHSSSYPPDVKYQDQFREAEKEARENNRGLWVSCDQEEKTATVSAELGQVESASTEAKTDCLIKGNISQSSGEKIYHMPGGDYYEKTVIGDKPEERMFCTEVEAQGAGWRKSKR